MTRNRYPLVLLAISCCMTAPTAFAADSGASTSASDSAGVRPIGASGKPLNFDFESGTLDGWKVEGEAFAKQPMKGDTVAARRRDMKSGHQGQYWIGSYEVSGDRPEGTITSELFEVKHRWLTFLVGG